MEEITIKDRPFLVFGLVYLLGSVLGVCSKWIVIGPFIGVCGLYMADTIRYREINKSAVRGLILLTAFVLAAIVGSWQKNYREDYYGSLEEGKEIAIHGQVYNVDCKHDAYRFYLKNCSINKDLEWISCNNVIVYADNKNIRLGEEIYVKGDFVPFSVARNYGNFDARNHYWAQKIDFSVECHELKILKRPTIYWRECLWSFKQWVSDLLYRAVGNENGGTIVSMILGNRDLLDDDIKNMYQEAGIMHILAISGLHISFIGMGLYDFLRKRKLSFLISMFFSLIFVIAYGMMVGGSVSTWRAIAMLALSQFAQLIGRTSDMLNSLGLVLFLLLVSNPFIFLYSGFQFSFMAIVGVAFVGDGFGGKVDRDYNKRERILASVKMSIGINLCTLPVVAFYYYEIPTYSFLLNLIVLPLLGVVIGDGFVSLFACCSLSLLHRLWDGVNLAACLKLCFLPGNTILNAYSYCCKVYMKMPFSVVITGKPTVAQMLFYYLVLWCLVMVARYENGTCTEDKKGRGLLKKIVLLSFCSLICLCVLLYKPGRDFSVDILDVGQGDGIYFSSSNGRECFIDGGSTTVKNVGENRIIPFLKAKSIRQVDYWFISHLDEDHYNGFVQVVEKGYRIKNLVLSKYIGKDECYENIVALSINNNINIVYMDAGNVLEFGDTKVKCLYPWANIYDDKNNQSMVLEIKDSNFEGIFLGDVASEAEELIMDKYDMTSVSMLKVAHHGSKYSSSKSFLQRMKPVLAVISVGEGNFYSHPNEEAVARIKESSKYIESTMNSGQIHITRKNGRMIYRKYIESE